MDYDVSPARGTIEWTPDPAYTPPEAVAASVPLAVESWPE
jgi:hypothetical protein